MTIQHPQPTRVPSANDRGNAIVELQSVVRHYQQGPHVVAALDGVSAQITGGTFVAVMGASGSGKTTLLQCAAGLDRPTTGSIRVSGHDVSRMSEGALTRFRRQHVGFVFQSYNLLTSLTVRQNVALPLRLGAKASARGAIESTLDIVGLSQMSGRRVGELSGGQQQRVALARALVTGPQVIFADEPTGALDPTTAAGILALLRSAVEARGVTVVMVTHDPVVAQWSDRVLLLAAGRLVGDFPTPAEHELAARLRATALVGANA